MSEVEKTVIGLHHGGEKSVKIIQLLQYNIHRLLFLVRTKDVIRFPGHTSIYFLYAYALLTCLSLSDCHVSE